MRTSGLILSALFCAAAGVAAQAEPVIKGKDLLALVAQPSSLTGVFDDVGEYRGFNNAGQDSVLEAAAYDQNQRPTDASAEPILIDCPANPSDPSYTLARNGEMNAGDAVDIKGRIDELTAAVRDMVEQGGSPKQLVHILLLQPGCTITPHKS